MVAIEIESDYNSVAARLDCDRVSVGLWLSFGRIVVGFRLNHARILIGSRSGSGQITIRFLRDHGWVLAESRSSSNRIVVGFWLNHSRVSVGSWLCSDHIVTMFWPDRGYSDRIAVVFRPDCCRNPIAVSDVEELARAENALCIPNYYTSLMGTHDIVVHDMLCTLLVCTYTRLILSRLIHEIIQSQLPSLRSQSNHDSVEVGVRPYWDRIAAGIRSASTMPNSRAWLRMHCAFSVTVHHVGAQRVGCTAYQTGASHTGAQGLWVRLDRERIPVWIWLDCGDPKNFAALKN